MASSTVLAAIQQAAAPLMPDGTTFLVGRELIAGEDAPPRVIFAYGPTDEFEGARNTRVPTPGVPRVLLTRKATFEAYLWGADYDQAEAMVNAMVAALYLVALGSMQIISGAWADVSVTAAGRAYRLTFTLDIPITEALPGTGTATDAPVTVTLA